MKSKKQKFDILFMKIALEISTMSHANRKKVGSVIVNNGNIISFGYNGTPNGFDNNAEDENGLTKKEVIHSELNAVIKAAKSGAKLENSTLYVTMSPCSNCSLLIIQSGIKRVVFLEEYRDNYGIEILKKANIEIEQIFI